MTLVARLAFLPHPPRPHRSTDALALPGMKQGAFGTIWGLEVGVWGVRAGDGDSAPSPMPSVCLSLSLSLSLSKGSCPDVSCLSPVEQMRRLQD